MKSLAIYTLTEINGVIKSMFDVKRVFNRHFRIINLNLKLS